MKKIRFVGAAAATTVKGELTFAPAVGLEIVSGKLFEPLPQSVPAGSTAGGAGTSGSPEADHEIGTAGVEGYEGGAVELGPVGLLGVVVAEFELEPHLIVIAIKRISATRKYMPQSNRTLRMAARMARMYEPPEGE